MQFQKKESFRKKKGKRQRKKGKELELSEKLIIIKFLERGRKIFRGREEKKVTLFKEVFWGKI